MLDSMDWDEESMGSGSVSSLHTLLPYEGDEECASPLLPSPVKQEQPGVHRNGRALGAVKANFGVAAKELVIALEQVQARESAKEAHTLDRFRRAVNQVIRKLLFTNVAVAEKKGKSLLRLGILAQQQGQADEAIEWFTRAAAVLDDDNAWYHLGQAELKAWEKEPATNHAHLERAQQAYQNCMARYKFNMFKVWEMPQRFFELGQIYENFGAFEGALAIYQQIAEALPSFPLYPEVLFRAVVVMKHLSTLVGAPRLQLLQQAAQALELAIAHHTQHQHDIPEPVMLLYGDICQSEGSARGLQMADSAYKHVFIERVARGMEWEESFATWEDWYGNPRTQLALGREWAMRGESSLSAAAYDKGLELARGGSLVTYDDLMDASEVFSSFQAVEKACYFAERALELKPHDAEARGLLRKICGGEVAEAHAKEDLVARLIQRKWRTRLWTGKHLYEARAMCLGELETRLQRSYYSDLQARRGLAYFSRWRHRPLFLYEDTCAAQLQRAVKTWLVRMRWVAKKQAKHERVLAKLYRNWKAKGPWDCTLRGEIVRLASSRYTPAGHIIRDVVAKVELQDRAVLAVQRCCRSYLARQEMKAMLARFMQMQALQQEKSAMAICMGIRRAVAVKELRNRRLLQRRRVEAAVVLQRIWRCRVNSWRYNLKMQYGALEEEKRVRREAACLRVQAWWRMVVAVRWKVCCIHGATTIQRVVRGRQSRTRAASLRRCCVMRIQSAWRKAMVQQRVLASLTSLREERMRHAAAEEAKSKRMARLEAARSAAGAATRAIEKERSLLEQDVKTMVRIVGERVPHLHQTLLAYSNTGRRELERVDQLLMQPGSRMQRLLLHEPGSGEQIMNVLLRVIERNRVQTLALGSKNWYGRHWQGLLNCLKENAFILRELVMEGGRAEFGEENGTRVADLLGDYLNRSFGSLVTLAVTKSDLGDRSARAIAKRLDGCQLKSLSLEWNLVSDEGAAALAEALISPKTALRYLNLDHNRITSMGGAELARSLKDPRCSLLTLRLEDNLMDDLVVAEFEEAINSCCTLSELVLDHNLFPCASAQGLAKQLALNVAARKRKATAGPALAEVVRPHITASTSCSLPRLRIKP
ncbi:unnamed protein product [Chrysoparadoxa australica]